MDFQEACLGMLFFVVLGVMLVLSGVGATAIADGPKVCRIDRTYDVSVFDAAVEKCRAKYLETYQPGMKPEPHTQESQ